MNKLYEIKMRLCDELEAYAGTEISRADLDTICKLTDSVKNIGKIIKMEDEYSMGGGWEARGMYSRNDGMSYGPYDGSLRDYSRANRGQHWVRGHYSRAEGKQQLMDDIEMLMQDNSLSVDERDALHRAKKALSK